MNPGQRNDHAIVIGGGVAGMLAARVLSDKFKQVTIIERDCSYSPNEFRRGTPQAAHVHNVLIRGNQIIADLYPNFFEEPFDRAGSPDIEVAKDQRLLGPFGWNPEYETGIKFKGYSRSLLDYQLFQHTKNISNVRFALNCEVQRILFNDGTARGLIVKQVGLSHEQDWSADLIVDASGRRSVLPQWLEINGFGTTRTRHIKIDEVYSSQLVRLRHDNIPWKQYAEIRFPPCRNRGVYALAIEEDQWIVGIVSAKGNAPPINRATFLAAARELATPEVENLLLRGDPLGPVRLFGNLECVCRFYDELPHWPNGIIALGDSVCTFNPIFGQGITTAATGSLILKSFLDQEMNIGWEQKFQGQLIEMLQTPWLYSVREDLRQPDLSKAGIIIRSYFGLRSWYRLKAFRLLLKTVPISPTDHKFLLELQNLMRPIISLFAPWRVCRWFALSLFRRPKASVLNNSNSIRSMRTSTQDSLKDVG